MHPRCIPTACTHDIHPRYTPTTCTHDAYPRQKWTNKSLVADCIKDLYVWIRAGPTSKEERIKYLKTLRSCSDEGTPTEDGKKCQTLVIEALLKYSKGKKGVKVFPYGDKAVKYTENFVQVPSPIFAITLACMYPFIVQDEDTHPTMMKRGQYPIKQLWPKSVLKRYLNFNDAVWEQRRGRKVTRQPVTPWCVVRSCLPTRTCKTSGRPFRKTIGKYLFLCNHARTHIHIHAHTHSLTLFSVLLLIIVP